MKTHQAVALTVASVVTCGCAVGRHHTTDAVLKNRFFQHRSEFESLLGDVRHDKNLQTIQPRILIYAAHWFDLHDQGSSGVIESLGLSMQRLSQYEQQLRVLELEGGVMQRQGEVEFRADQGSLFNGDSYKGYIFRGKAPPHLLSDLDEYSVANRDKTPLGDWVVYKPLSGNWYLYLFVNR